MLHASCFMLHTFYKYMQAMQKVQLLKGRSYEVEYCAVLDCIINDRHTEYKTFCLWLLFSEPVQHTDLLCDLHATSCQALHTYVEKQLRGSAHDVHQPSLVVNCTYSNFLFFGYDFARTCKIELISHVGWWN